MTGWIEVLRAPVENDLAPFSRYLQEQGITPYIFEQSGWQCLCVPAATDPAFLQQLVTQWHSGEINISLYQQPVVDSYIAAPTVFADWQKFPLTIVLLVFSALTCFMVATPWGESLGGLQWLATMTLQPIVMDGDKFRLLATLPSVDQVWRYWTPVFLHFSAFHILFNGLMLLELGRRVEMLQGSQRLLFLVMATGLTSNLTQFYAAPANLFGGLSGVIYALVGYTWLYQRLRPSVCLVATPGLMAMALVWLVLCLSGLVTMAGMGEIANAAHVGGLLSGLVFAVLLALLDKRLP